jgi:hypothetical protein
METDVARVKPVGAVDSDSPMGSSSLTEHSDLRVAVVPIHELPMPGRGVAAKGCCWAACLDSGEEPAFERHLWMTDCIDTAIEAVQVPTT